MTPETLQELLPLPRALGLFIANGVTGIRMMLGVPRHHEWRQSVSAGELVGLRLRIASGVFDGPKPVWPRSISVSNEQEARVAVRQSRDVGADFIKIYELLPREACFAIADESKKLRIPFVGHVPETILAQEAAEAGQKSIEHRNLDERFARFPEMYEGMQRIADQLEESIERGMSVDEAEEIAIAQINKLGKAWLRDWARAQHERSLSAVRREIPQAIKQSKKLKWLTGLGMGLRGLRRCLETILEFKANI